MTQVLGQQYTDTGIRTTLYCDAICFVPLLTSVSICSLSVRPLSISNQFCQFSQNLLKPGLLCVDRPLHNVAGRCATLRGQRLRGDDGILLDNDDDDDDHDDDDDDNDDDQVFCLIMGVFDGCFITMLGPIAFDICGPAGAG